MFGSEPFEEPQQGYDGTSADPVHSRVVESSEQNFLENEKTSERTAPSGGQVLQGGALGTRVGGASG